MLALLKDYLQIGADASADHLSIWPLAVATMLVAAAILYRQSQD